MKKLKFLSLLILGVCLSTHGFARNRIVLKGSWNRIEKSITPNIPIQVWLEDNNRDITVEFLKNLGPVDISIITSEGNIVCNTVIDGGEFSTHIITLDTELDNLDYEIIVSNKDNMVQGLLTIDKEYK